MSEHGPVEVRTEVWHSLVSMLRVYAHAASLNGKPFAVSSVDFKALVKYEDSSLTISFSPEEGMATWRLIRPGRDQQGPFQIDEHGAVVFPDGPRELDTAAIDWMDQLSNGPVYEASQSDRMGAVRMSSKL